MLSLLPVGWHEQQRQPSPVAATALSPTPPPTGASSGRWLQPCRCAPPTFTSACASMRAPPSVGRVACPVCRLCCSWADAPPGTHAQPHCSRAARARSGAFGGRPPPRAAPRAARAQASGMRRRLLGADAGAGAGIVGGEDSHAVAESTAATRRRTTIRGSFTLHVRQRPTSSQPPLPPLPPFPPCGCAVTHTTSGHPAPSQVRGTTGQYARRAALLEVRVRSWLCGLLDLPGRIWLELSATV
jgi:hypothetical protein